MKPIQVVLQTFVSGFVFMGRRIPSPAIYRSIGTSTLMIMFALTKALMSQQISHTKKKSKLKQVKQLVWIVCLAGTIFTSKIFILNILLFAFLSYGKDYNRLPPSKQSLITPIIGLSLFVFTYIFVYKNCFKQHLQTKVRFITLSIYHFLMCMAILNEIVGHLEDNIGSSGVATILLPFFMLSLSLVFVYMKGAFSVPKLNDIWSLEKMTSKELCFIPNLLFTIVFLPCFSTCLFFVLYSFGVFPTFYH